MKGKITIVLFSLVLVFGMIAASCDNGAFPAQDEKDYNTYFAYEGNYKGLPTNTTNPVLVKGKALVDKLNEKTLYGTTTPQSVGPKYKLVKAGKIGTYTYNTTEEETLKKYSGMPLIVEIDYTP